MSWAMEADLSKRVGTAGSRAGAATAVHVNGEPRMTSATTLAAFMEEAGYGDARVATALNGAFVAVRARAKTTIRPGDRIEIVAPRQGG
jgi:sulfur carrier protein